MTDPIADMLTRIRNAVHGRHTRVDVPASRFKVEIARILEKEGYIQGFKELEAGEAPRPSIRLFLKYGPRGENVISGLERVSRPGRRVYLGTFLRSFRRHGANVSPMSAMPKTDTITAAVCGSSIQSGVTTWSARDLPITPATTPYSGSPIFGSMNHGKRRTSW